MENQQLSGLVPPLCGTTRTWVVETVGCIDIADVPKGDRYVNGDVMGERSAANADTPLSCPSFQFLLLHAALAARVAC